MARGKSMTEIQILNLLNIRPMYGVEMIEEIKRLSGNVVVMSLPTLYSSLHKLAAKKFVNSYWQEAEIGGRRHVYNITRAGREYREKNPMEINYALLKEHQTDEHQTFASLEEAFSLPLNNKPAVPELPEEKRVIKLEPKEPKPDTNKNKIAPYLMPTDKITTTATQHKQMSINLTGTIGSADLRPLLKLNQVPVGNDFVTINSLRLIANLIAVGLFLLVDFLCSLTRAIEIEYYNLIDIFLITYFAIVLAIFWVFPKVKAIFVRGKSFRIRTLSTLILFGIVGVICLINHSLKLIWLGIFAFLPIVEFICMVCLRKGRFFRC